jgi:hypothetical protein
MLDEEEWRRVEEHLLNAARVGEPGRSETGEVASGVWTRSVRSALDADERITGFLHGTEAGGVSAVGV